jgi:hypothetical protein
MGEITRRAVLGGAIGTAGVVAFGVGPAVAATARGAAPVRADYANAVGRVFSVEHGGRTHRIKLTHLHSLSPSTAKQREHNFMMIFAPVDREQLPDAVYRLRRRGVRTHRLFLSTVGTDRGLQAVIYRQR